MTNEIFCSWVNTTVNRENLGEFCDENIIDGRCMHCPVSPLIELGMKPSELLRNISKK